MNILTFKSRKTLMLYLIMGIIHSLLTMYVSIPISSFFSVPHTWNRNVWTIIVIICIIAVSLFEKKLYKVKYMWILVTALCTVFITSFCCAMLIFTFTPTIMF